jgi:hypothetical protein
MLNEIAATREIRKCDRLFLLMVGFFDGSIESGSSVTAEAQRLKLSSKEIDKNVSLASRVANLGGPVEEIDLDESITKISIEEEIADSVEEEIAKIFSRLEGRLQHIPLDTPVNSIFPAGNGVSLRLIEEEISGYAA